jgi:hypothetical protein
MTKVGTVFIASAGELHRRCQSLSGGRDEYGPYNGILVILAVLPMGCTDEGEEL